MSNRKLKNNKDYIHKFVISSHTRIFDNVIIFKLEKYVILENLERQLNSF